MIDDKFFFDQPINSNLKTYDNIKKVATGQGDDYTTGCLSGYTYFKNYYKMVVVDLRKQKALDADPKGIQQLNFTANLDIAENTRIYIILEEKKKKLFLNFHKGL